MFSSYRLNRQLGLIFSCILIFAITGLRYNVGYDYETYVFRYYQEISPREPISNLIFNFSLTYENSDIYFLIYSLLTAATLFFVAKNERNPWIIVNFYFLPWFFVESMTLVRQFGAIALCILAYYHYVNNNRNYLYISGLISSLCHYSSIPFVILLFALRQGSSVFSKVVILCSAAAIIFLQADLLRFTLGGLGIYDVYQKGNTHGTGLLVLYFLVFLLSFRKDGTKDATYIIFIGLVANFFLLEIDSSLTRLAWFFLIPFLWFRWDKVFYYIKLNSFFRMFALVFLVSVFVFSLFIKSQDPLTRLIPYQSIITEKYL